MSDPRACRINICDFDHMSQKEVAEHERLAEEAKRRLLEPHEGRRLLELSRRRYRVPAEPVSKGAA
jgi:hypothetical protein